MKSIQIAEGKLARGPLPAMFSARHYEQVKAFHQSLAGYAPTPLIHLEALAKQLGIRAILVKDESQRFGLKAFKALGASYAVHQILAEMPDQKPVFVTTTDGNHGKGVAWAALQAGCRRAAGQRFLCRRGPWPAGLKRLKPWAMPKSQ